jgi:hypothetical protein
MTKLRSIAVVAVLGAALFASRAQAEDGGWTSKYGMIFTIQNVFGNNDASTLSDFGGSVGLQYNLAPQSALRLQVNLSRASRTGSETERTDLVTGVVTKEYTPPAGFTSQYAAGFGAAYMMRLTTDAIAPYVGAGGGIGYSQTALNYEDDITSATVTYARDDMTRTIGLGADGILGLEWRVHKSMALFAEYTLGLTLVQMNSTSNEWSNTVNATGAVASGQKEEYSSTTFFNFGTGIGQGGLIGLVAFF